MAESRLLPALALERAALEPIATVSVLHTLRPVASRLHEVLSELPVAGMGWMDALLERTGSAIVFQGHPSAALHIDNLLRGAGLTTSVNFLSVRRQQEGQQTGAQEDGGTTLM